MKYSRLFLLCLVIFLSSCTVRQELFLDQDGSGETTVHIGLTSMLERYLTDLAELSGQTGGNIAVFHIPAIKEAFSAFPELTLENAQIPEDDELLVTVEFTDVKEVFNPVDVEQADFGGGSPGSVDGKTVRNVIDVSSDARLQTVTLFIDRSNYRRIIDRVFQLGSLEPYLPYFEGLLRPGPKEVMLDIYEYAFEQYTPEKPVEEILEHSFIVLDVYVQGTITEHNGGRTIQGEPPYTRGIRYTIPLFDMLTLEHPITYTISYRP